MKSNLFEHGTKHKDLHFWIQKFIASKVNVIQQNKEISTLIRDEIYKDILKSKNIDELRTYTNQARKKGLNSLPEYFYPLFKFFNVAIDDKNIIKITDINTAYLYDYYKVILSSYKASTQQLHSEILRIFFDFIDENNFNVKEDCIYKFNIGFLENGKQSVKPIDRPKKIKQVELKEKELIEFLSEIKNNKFNHPNKFQTILLIKLLCYGGLRKEELVNLKLYSFSFITLDEKKYLKLFLDNTKKNRIVYIEFPLIEDSFNSFLLLREDTQTTDNSLFITWEGKQYSKRSLEDMIKRAVRNTILGNRGLTPDRLRLASKILQISPTYLSEESYQEEIQSIKSGIIFDYAPILFQKTFNEKGEEQKVIRSARVARFALDEANNKCIFDDKHITFTGKNEKQYMEAHHVIPMEFQSNFKFSLDVPSNIVSVCPNCHRNMHYSVFSEKKSMISMLYNQRYHQLNKSGIAIDLDILEKYYERY